MKSRTSVLRRVTISVAASALVSALIGFGSPVSNATTQSTSAWRQAIAALDVPGQGCFTASFPAIQWRPTACSSVHPKDPQQFAGTEPSQQEAGGGSQQVGGNCNTCDYAAKTAAPMTGADGSFPSVTCAASPCESGRFEDGPVGPTPTRCNSTPNSTCQRHNRAARHCCRALATAGNSSSTTATSGKSK